jgi:hypothetical protein
MSQPMSAYGPKQTSVDAPHMSAFGGKADMTLCRNPILRSLLGLKRTCPCALHVSAHDPKRTFPVAPHIRAPGNSLACLSSRASLQASGLVSA